MGEGYKLSLKPYKISKMITGMKDNYLKSEANIMNEAKRAKESMSAKTEEI